MKKFKFLGFTLAEVLITLAIVGIVAALTLPTLIQNHQKKVAATRLKSTYSILAQAIMLSENDNGPESGWVVDKEGYSGTKITGNFIKTYIEPYLKTVKRDDLKTSSSPYDYYYRKNGELVKVSGHSHYSIALTNGIYLHFNASYDASDEIKVRIDINGEQAPNIIGRDIFTFRFYPKLKSLENVDRNTLLKMCGLGSLQDQAIACPALIMMDGWQISKDYPW